MDTISDGDEAIQHLKLYNLSLVPVSHLSYCTHYICSINHCITITM